MHQTTKVINHPSGTTFFNDRQALDEQMNQVLMQMGTLQSHMTPVLFDAFVEEYKADE